MAKVTIPLSCTVPMRGVFQSCQVTGTHPRRYVAQEDHLLPTSTVYDTLNLSAQLRLPRTMSKEDKARARLLRFSRRSATCAARPTRCGTLWSCTRVPSQSARVESMLKQFRLGKCRNTMVGTADEVRWGPGGAGVGL